MKKDKTLIPKGYYCYTYKDNQMHIPCPYWRKNLNKPEQANGYCKFIEKGDWDINAEVPDMIEVECRQSDGTYKKEMMPKENFPNRSLLWDMCKECHINMEDNDNEL